MAMFSLREYLNKQGFNLDDYEIIGSQSIHPAWNKAAFYFNMNLRQFEIDYTNPINP
jgi:glutamate/tyrosine decarboxylase-like PLP-dependent enzyme